MNDVNNEEEVGGASGSNSNPEANGPVDDATRRTNDADSNSDDSSEDESSVLNMSYPSYQNDSSSEMSSSDDSDAEDKVCSFSLTVP